MFRALMPVDGNVDRALEQARAISALPNATEAVTVVVLHVFEESAVDESSELVDPERVHAVNEAVSLLEEGGIDVEARSVVGDVAGAVGRVADEMDADGIFVSGRRRSPVGKAVFGSTAQQIILDADRPVTITVDG